MTKTQWTYIHKWLTHETDKKMCNIVAILARLRQK